MSGSSTQNVIATDVPLPAINSSPRAMAIAAALRVAARHSRTLARPRDANFKSTIARIRQRPFSIGVLASLFFLVIIPAIVSGAYVSFFASKQYVTYTNFSLRDGEHRILDVVSGLLGLSATERMQNALILTDYVKSRTIFEQLDKTIGLRDRFDRSDIDYFSRLEKNASIEEAVSYWIKHVDISIDYSSGITTVAVRAFSPKDSYDIANGILKLSEALVNDISERSRRDTLQAANEQLVRAQNKMSEALSELRSIRNAEGTLDASKSADSLSKLETGLRMQLLELEQQQAVILPSIDKNAPQAKILNSRIENLREQIKNIEMQIASVDLPPDGSQPLSQAMQRLEKGKLDSKIAEKQYVMAAASLEAAKADFEMKQIYLIPFVQPTLAQDAIYPRRLLTWSLVTIVLLMVWGLGIGAAVLVRNYGV
jgi:capsular polysaccharide transport system permease protein